jgi:hypothetical protein
MSLRSPTENENRGILETRDISDSDFTPKHVLSSFKGRQVQNNISLFFAALASLPRWALRELPGDMEWFVESSSPTSFIGSEKLSH